MPPKREALTDFPERLRAYRQIRGLDIGEIAKEVGVNRSTVGHWETGHREPSLAKLVKLAAVLRVSTDRLLTGKGWAGSDRRKPRQGG